MLYNINGFIRKLPVDYKCAIPQSFAAFFFSTPLSFFSEFLVQFLGSNEKGMEARAYIGWETPCRPWGAVARGGRQDPVARWGGATGPLPPHTPGQGSLCKFKKNTLRSCRPLLGRQDPCRPWGRRPGAIFEIFKNGHIFLNFLFF